MFFFKTAKNRFIYYFCVTPLWGGTKIFAYALTKTKR